MTMTFQRAAQSALDVQCACNLSGVVRSFAEIVSWLRTQPGVDVRTHPICQLFAVQIGYLTGVSLVSDDSFDYLAASKVCEALAAAPVVVTERAS